MNALVASMAFFSRAGSGWWNSSALPMLDQRDRAVGEPLLHLGPLGGGQDSARPCGHGRSAVPRRAAWPWCNSGSAWAGPSPCPRGKSPARRPSSARGSAPQASESAQRGGQQPGAQGERGVEEIAAGRIRHGRAPFSIVATAIGRGRRIKPRGCDPWASAATRPLCSEDSPDASLAVHQTSRRTSEVSKTSEVSSARFPAIPRRTSGTAAEIAAPCCTRPDRQTSHRVSRTKMSSLGGPAIPGWLAGGSASNEARSNVPSGAGPKWIAVMRTVCVYCQPPSSMCFSSTDSSTGTPFSFPP